MSPEPETGSVVRPDPLQRGFGHIVVAGIRLLAALLRLLRLVGRWQTLARERRTLLELDDRMLRDIGLTRDEVLREARRPFWDDAPRDRWS